MTAYFMNEIFSQDTLKKLFPADRADRFFDALFGDATEGAFDIYLQFKAYNENKLEFEFHLKERPGKCLACHLTYGLPQVFLRHPVINIKGLVQEIDRLLDGKAKCGEWQLGLTHKISRKLHVLPLTVFLDK